MGCNEFVKLESSAKVVGPKGIKRWEYNVAAVWRQMATGGGYSKLNETMATLGYHACLKRTSLPLKGRLVNVGEINYMKA